MPRTYRWRYRRGRATAARPRRRSRNRPSAHWPRCPFPRVASASTLLFGSIFSASLALAAGYGFRDDPGDFFGRVEAGGEPVLGERERRTGGGVGVRVAPA